MARRIETRAQLRDYIRKRLGYPTYNIELTDEALDLVIDEAIDKFLEIAYSGTQVRFAVLSVKKDQQLYQLPDEVVSILYIYNEYVSSSLTDPFSFKNLVATDILRKSYSQPFCKIDLLTYDLAKQFIETLNLLTNVKVEFDFNTITKQLYLIQKPERDENYGVLYYELLNYDFDNDDNNYIYNNRFIKKYATELARKEWGLHLLKYGGSLLPNGLQINVDALIDSAESELEKLEEELNEKYQLPIDFFVG